MPSSHTGLAFAAAAIALAGGAMVAAQQALPVANERARPDANGDGLLTRAEATAHAAAQFARMDANSDGRVTPEDREAGRERLREAMFARIDADSDGSLTRAEWDRAGAATDQRRELRRGERAGRGQQAQQGPRGRGGRRGQMGRTMLANADANGDGAIDRAEFIAAASTRFDRLDADGNDAVSAAERQAQRAAVRGRTSLDSQ